MGFYCVLTYDSVRNIKVALWCFPQSLLMVISRYSSSLCTFVPAALARCQSQRSCQTPPPRWSRGFLCVLYYGAGAHTWRWVGSVVQLCSYTEVFAGRTTAVLFLHRRTVVLLLFCSLVCVMWDCTYVWWPLGLTFLSFRWMWNFFDFLKGIVLKREQQRARIHFTIRAVSQTIFSLCCGIMFNPHKNIG